MAGYEEELRSCTGGSYRVAITIPGINHYTFTDWPLLEAKNKEDFEKGRKALELLENYVIAFFDKQLKRAQGTILHNPRDCFGRRCGNEIWKMTQTLNDEAGV